MLMIGSLQTHHATMYDICPIFTAAMGEGGGQIPMAVEIIVLGNYMPSNYDSSKVVGVDGVAPTVRENHGTVTATVEVTDVTDNSKELR